MKTSNLNWEIKMVIESKVLGQRKRPYEPWELDSLEQAKLEGKEIVLRDFLKQMVLQEVEAFHMRQEERKLCRLLTKEDIEKGKAIGKIDSAAKDFIQEVDPIEAVEAALLAFADGFYYVFVDDVQIEKLEDVFRLEPQSHVLFLRLVPLAGG